MRDEDVLKQVEEEFKTCPECKGEDFGGDYMYQVCLKCGHDYSDKEMILRAVEITTSRLRSLIEKKIDTLWNYCEEHKATGYSGGNNRLVMECPKCMKTFKQELLSELSLSGTEKDESENLYPERPSGRMTDKEVLASSPSEIPADQEQIIGCHFQEGGCIGKDCKCVCHKRKEAENGGKVEMGESPSDSAESRKLIQDLLPSETSKCSCPDDCHCNCNKCPKCLRKRSGVMTISMTDKCCFEGYNWNECKCGRTYRHKSDCPLSKKEVR